MDIFEEVRELGFPQGKYVVVGSGIMTAYGLKEARDIDIVVTRDLFEELGQSSQWKPRLNPSGGLGLAKGPVEVYLDVNCGDYDPTTEDLIENAEIINGIPFISLQELIRFKREYGRPKDLQHIKMIEDFLRNRTVPN